jgi:hypothetical protein
VRDRSDVFDETDLQTCGGNTSDGRFAAGTGAIDPYFNFLHTISHGALGSFCGYNLSGVGSAFSRTFESNFTGRTPGYDITVNVGDGNLGVVECGDNVDNTVRNGDVLVLGAFFAFDRSQYNGIRVVS